MAMRFSLKRCAVDELLTHRELINELTAGHELPVLHVVAQQYRGLEAQRSAMCSMLMDGAEAVGFLIARQADPLPLTISSISLEVAIGG